MEDPVSVVKLPSGAVVELRELKGKEGKLLSDKEAIKSGMFLDKILTACTVNVVDPGPYKPVAVAPVDGGAPRQVLDWSKVLIGDRFFALVHIRIISLGDSFCFKLQCSQEGCRKRFEQEITLSKDLTVRILSDEDRAVFASSNLFETRDANGKLIRYRLPTGHDEVIAARSTQSMDGAFMAALLQRIESIEDEVVPRVYLEDCGFGKLLDLLQTFDEHNCGVNTSLEIECPHCGNLEDVELPFARGFLVPSKRPTKKI
jgi:hypothetical protein